MTLSVTIFTCSSVSVKLLNSLCRFNILVALGLSMNLLRSINPFEYAYDAGYDTYDNNPSKIQNVHLFKDMLEVRAYRLCTCTR